MSLLCCLKCLQVNKSYTELTFHTFVNISKPQTTLIIKGGKLISQRPCSALRNMAFDRLKRRILRHVRKAATCTLHTARAATRAGRRA